MPVATQMRQGTQHRCDAPNCQAWIEPGDWCVPYGPNGDLSIAYHPGCVPKERRSAPEAPRAVPEEPYVMISAWVPPSRVAGVLAAFKEARK
jgi:hypothetical protein